MKKIIGTLTMIVLGFLLIILLLRYNIGMTKHDSLVTSLEMNIRTVVADHFSNGARVQPKGINVTDLEAFESSFNSMMKSYSTSNVAGNKSKLQYLVEVGNTGQRIEYIQNVKENDKILGVKVSYELDGRDYNLRYVLEELADTGRR